MPKDAHIHIVPIGERDWVIREEGTNREFGHYSSEAEARMIGSRLARKRGSENAQQTST